MPLYFDYLAGTVQRSGDRPGEWMPDDTKFLQYRTEIARRARFLMQSPGKMGDTKTLGAIIFKQGQEGQGRPADAFIRRFVKSGTGNPYKFENMRVHDLPRRDLRPAGLSQRRRRQAQRGRLQLQRLG